MTKREYTQIELEDAAGNLLHATWSRSGKRLVVSAIPRGRWRESAQVEIGGEQVERLRQFLAESSPAES